MNKNSPLKIDSSQLSTDISDYEKQESSLIESSGTPKLYKYNLDKIAEVEYHEEETFVEPNFDRKTFWANKFK